MDNENIAETGKFSMPLELRDQLKMKKTLFVVNMDSDKSSRLFMERFDDEPWKLTLYHGPEIGLGYLVPHDKDDREMWCDRQEVNTWDGTDLAKQFNNHISSMEVVHQEMDDVIKGISSVEITPIQTRRGSIIGGGYTADHSNDVSDLSKGNSSFFPSGIHTPRNNTTTSTSYRELKIPQVPPKDDNFWELESHFNSIIWKDMNKEMERSSNTIIKPNKKGNKDFYDACKNLDGFDLKAQTTLCVRNGAYKLQQKERVWDIKDNKENKDIFKLCTSRLKEKTVNRKGILMPLKDGRYIHFLPDKNARSYWYSESPHHEIRILPEKIGKHLEEFLPLFPDGKLPCLPNSDGNMPCFKLVLKNDYSNISHKGMIPFLPKLVKYNTSNTNKDTITNILDHYEDLFLLLPEEAQGLAEVSVHKNIPSAHGGKRRLTDNEVFAWNDRRTDLLKGINVSGYELHKLTWKNAQGADYHQFPPVTGQLHLHQNNSDNGAFLLINNIPDPWAGIDEALYQTMLQTPYYRWTTHDSPQGRHCVTNDPFTVSLQDEITKLERSNTLEYAFNQPQLLPQNKAFIPVPQHPNAQNALQTSGQPELLLEGLAWTNAQGANYPAFNNPVTGKLYLSPKGTDNGAILKIGNRNDYQADIGEELYQTMLQTPYYGWTFHNSTQGRQHFTDDSFTVSFQQGKTVLGRSREQQHSYVQKLATRY